ncbi:MAG: hypothetical protein NWE89_00995 [Candidatus Bathyarchaeota archaeon]|nr:hypothetical protein [Candidatus Bathyarchaeota archaeon]
MKENMIRSIELGVAVGACYMAAVTMVQTSLFAKIVAMITNSFLGRLLEPYMPYFNLAVIVLAVFLCITFWRKGDEIWFGRIFSLNMLMFFPAVLDFSTFNWVGLILDLGPGTQVTDIWVFAVGLLLQVTYLMLRYTVRFRYMRDELIHRGAVEEDLEHVSRGQMGYLTLLVFLTIGFTGGIYIAIPYVNQFTSEYLRDLPMPHAVIGFVVVLLIAASMILYLRGSNE